MATALEDRLTAARRRRGGIMAKIPAAPPADRVRAALARRIRGTGAKIAVVDDDPTGTQTVRGVPLVTGWEEAELEWAMEAAQPTFAVLTNTRALSQERAVAINREAGARIAAVARRLGVEVRAISRSDSTLRGHFPAEPEALAAGLGEAGEPVDRVLVCPAFPEAGRVTVDDVHWVICDGCPVPAAETEFARDAAFGYRSSNLLDWVRERAGKDEAVASISLDDVRRGGAERVAERLTSLGRNGRYVVANAVESADLAVLALGVELAEELGLRVVCRTGPSFVSARAGSPTAAPLSRREIAMPRGRGLLVVGSHTQLTTAQLQEACRHHDLSVVMLDVGALLAAAPGVAAAAVARAIDSLRSALAHGDAALVTSRIAAYVEHGERSLATAAIVADTLVEIVAALARETPLDWLVAKGGITSHDMAVRALGTRRATVLGQLFPGMVSVWELGQGALRPGLRYVVFPGNVGDELTLARTLDRLKGLT